MKHFEGCFINQVFVLDLIKVFILDLNYQTATKFGVKVQNEDLDFKVRSSLKSYGLPFRLAPGQV